MSESEWMERVSALINEVARLTTLLGVYKDCCKGQEPMPCHVCGRMVLRNRGRMHHRKVTCENPKCKAIQKLGHDRPANFKNCPNSPGPGHADRTYYGGYHE